MAATPTHMVKREALAARVQLLLIPALCFALVFGIVRPFVVELFRIPSASMEPTLRAGDRVLVSKSAYRLGNPEHGDVVAFRSPHGRDIAIKRVAGLGGDRVAIKDGVLVVNGQPRKEPYVDRKLVDGTYFGPVTVPPGQLFVLGDNRSNSVDSRTLGSIGEGDLLGEAFWRAWPPGRMGAL